MKEEKQQAEIVYISFFIAILCNFIPNPFIHNFGAFAFFGLVIVTYVLRHKADKESYTHSHMAFLIKTFWISSLVLLIGMVIAGLLGDHSIIHSAIDGAKRGIILSEKEIYAFMMQYGRANALLFTLTLTPSIIYFVARLVKGFMQAKKGNLIDNPKSWL